MKVFVRFRSGNSMTGVASFSEDAVFKLVVKDDRRESTYWIPWTSVEWVKEETP